MTFTPFMHDGGDILERVPTPLGLRWKTQSRRYAWGALLDLHSEAETARGLGDHIHARRLAGDAECLLKAICAADEWHRASAPYQPANDRQRECV